MAFTTVMTMDNKLSFLCLPAELRNQVYSYLTEHDRVIHVAFLDGSPTTPRFVVTNEQGCRSIKLTDWNRAAQPPNALFRTCRQIYHESLPMYYRNNTFRLCRVPNTVSRNGRDINHAFGTEFGVAWLKRLGSRAEMLRNVEINVEHIFPSYGGNTSNDSRFCSFLEREGLANLGPLLRMIWSKNLQVDVSFVRPCTVKRKTIPRITPWFGAPIRMPYDLNALNSSLSQVLQGEIDIKKYCRTIGVVGVRRDGLGGIITFRTTSRRGIWEWPASSTDTYAIDGHYQSDNVAFFETDHNSHPRVLPCSPPTLSTLPEHINDQIAAYVLTPKPVYNINLDTAAGLQAVTGPCFINKTWRDKYSHMVYRNTYNLELTSTHSRAELHGMTRLGRLLRTEFYLGGPWRAPFGHEAQHTISISFTLSESARMQDVSFNIIPLLEATRTSCSDNTKITISLHTNKSNAGPRTLTRSYTIKQLRPIALHAWPTHLVDAKNVCPEVWMNGVGEVVDVREGKTCVRSTMKGDWNRKGGEEVGGVAGEMLEWLVKECHGGRKGRKRGKGGKQLLSQHRE